jgi:hypothetical protein
MLKGVTCGLMACFGREKLAGFLTEISSEEKFFSSEELDRFFRRIGSIPPKKFLGRNTREAFLPKHFVGLSAN